MRLRRDDVRLPDATVIDGHHVVEMPRPAVGVVPRGDDGRILLIEHFRFITDTTGWEIPAGGFDAGEDLAAAAARELLEETGHAADRFDRLGSYHLSNGLSNQTFHVAVGSGLRRVGDLTDTNEGISLRWFEADAVRAMLRRNQSATA